MRVHHHYSLCNVVMNQTLSPRVRLLIHIQQASMEQNLQKRSEFKDSHSHQTKTNSRFSSMEMTFRTIILLAHTSPLFLKVAIHPTKVYGSEVLWKSWKGFSATAWQSRVRHRPVKPHSCCTAHGCLRRRGKVDRKK